jgi:hypothetical protein
MDNTPIIEGETMPEMTPMPKIQGKAMTMDFPDAIREVIKGNKIARVEWGNEDYGFLKDESLGIFTKGRFFTYWNVSQGDMEAQDWIVVKEVN